MANLPARATSDVAADHVADHNSLHTFHNLIDAAGDLIVGTGADTAGRLAKGAASSSLRVNAAATALEWTPPGHKFANYSGGDITVSSTTFVTVSSTLDLTLAAAVGDVIEYGVGYVWGNEANQGRMDAATWVAGAAVNYFGGGASGLGASPWLGPPSAQLPVGGSLMKTLVSGDLSAGTVTLRLLVKVGAGSKTLYANTGLPIQVWAKNLGPAAP